MQAIEMQMTQLAFLWLLLKAIAFALGMWLTYYVIKTAIRDGIRESGLLERRSEPRTWRDTVAAAKGEHLPDMRAER